MSLEQTKTAVLFVLVALSIFLTTRLWYGGDHLPTAPAMQQQEQPLGQQKETAQLLAPIRGTLALGNGEYARLDGEDSLLSQVWQEVALRLKEGGSWGREQAWEPAAPPPDLDAAGTWRLFLPGSLTPDQWGGMLAHEEYQAHSQGPPLTQLVVTPAGSGYLYVPGEGYIPWLEGLELPQTPQGSYSLEREPSLEGFAFADGLTVPQEEVRLSQLRGLVERLSDEYMADSFFMDMSLVRKIRERDGAVIYTDGQRALRLYPSGAAEYTFPGLKGEGIPLQLSSAWERGRVFVEQHGGWPDHIRIDRVETREQEGDRFFHLSFQQYHRGMPLLLPEPAVTIHLHGRGVQLFERQALLPPYPGDISQPVVHPLDLLADNRELLAGGTDREPLVTDFYLAYQGRFAGEREIVLNPLWVVEIEGEKFFFDAYTGQGQTLGSRPAEEGLAWIGAGQKIS